MSWTIFISSELFRDIPERNTFTVILHFLVEVSNYSVDSQDMKISIPTFMSAIIWLTRAQKKDLHIMGLFPMTGKVFRGGNACLLGADLALRQIKDRDDLLENFNLNLIWRDSKVNIFISFFLSFFLSLSFFLFLYLSFSFFLSVFFSLSFFLSRNFLRKHYN